MALKGLQAAGPKLDLANAGVCTLVKTWDVKAWPSMLVERMMQELCCDPGKHMRRKPSTEVPLLPNGGDGASS